MGVLENAKEISELIKKYNDQALYEKIVELREQIISLREDNLALKQSVNKLEASMRIERELIKEGNAYFRENDTDRKQPFCLTCWDVDRNLVSLIVRQSQNGKAFSCNICKNRGT